MMIQHFLNFLYLMLPSRVLGPNPYSGEAIKGQATTDVSVSSTLACIAVTFLKDWSFRLFFCSFLFYSCVSGRPLGKGKVSAHLSYSSFDAIMKRAQLIVSENLNESCLFFNWPQPKGYNPIAINSQMWDRSRMCGACIEITNQYGTHMAVVTDQSGVSIWCFFLFFFDSYHECWLLEIYI
jgi:hypothetical protein